MALRAEVADSGDKMGAHVTESGSAAWRAVGRLHSVEVDIGQVGAGPYRPGEVAFVPFQVHT